MADYLINKVELNGGAVLLDLTGDTATPAHVLANDTFHDKSGQKQLGTMQNRGYVSESITGLTTMSYAIKSGYYAGGEVHLTRDIENALKAI